MEVPDFLTEHAGRLIFFGGKGGVGKTTCAVSAALHVSSHFATGPVLLLSTDPAHSLSDSLAGISLPENLEIMEFDAAHYLEEFKTRNGDRLREIADRGTFLDKQDVSRFLDLSMPGLDEFFGFLEIARMVEETDYFRIIVDTAPTGHTFRLLSMPELFKKWIEALDSLLAKHRYIKETFQGFYEPDELDEFVSGLDDSVKRFATLLKDRSLSRFVPVTIAEELGIRETARLLDNLDALGMRADEVIVNMIVPETDCTMAGASSGNQGEILKQLPPEFHGRTLWTIPLFPHEIRGDTLVSFWDNAFGHSPLPPYRKVDKTGFSTRTVENPAPLPEGELRLIMFAGKGGVGKTTLASATALRLSADYPGKKVLLLSIDPAHSLSDCLDLHVGPGPVEILPGLSAMEIDPGAEFNELKEAYSHEIEEFFDYFLQNVELEFDRETMEHLLDLSPPGLDELMALTRIMDYLGSNKYDTIVVDTAPTGHFLRLLELPEIVDQWIKAFFELFLKYRNLFRMPQMAERLIAFSKNLKRLRSILRNGRQASVYAVTIPTEMARAETSDLLAACERLGIAVPLLFVNMVTPPGKSPFCIEINEKESEVIRVMHREFSSQFHTLIYRQSELRALNLLIELGNRLYSN